VRIEPRPAIRRLAILFLAFSVVVLSAAAKHNRFLPKSNPAHFLSKASKMNLGPSPDFVPLATRTIPNTLPVPAEFRVLALIQPENLAASQIGLILCLQHRSPPLSLA